MIFLFLYIDFVKNFKKWLRKNFGDILFYSLGVIIYSFLIIPYLEVDTLDNYQPSGVLMFFVVIYSMVLLIWLAIKYGNRGYYDDGPTYPYNRPTHKHDPDSTIIYKNKEYYQKLNNGGFTDKEVKKKKDDIRKNLLN
jgi:hypothetical protein